MQRFKIFAAKIDLTVFVSHNNNPVLLFFSYRPAVHKVSVIFFNILVKCGLCKTPVRTYDVGAPSAITISLPGMSPSDAERRRYVILQLALKAYTKYHL